MRNTLIIALNTFREAIRQRLIALIAVLAVVLVALSNYLLKIDLGHEQLRFIADFGSGALGFFGSVIAITATCQLIYSEIDSKTLLTLMSKPVGFAQFAFGKLAGVAMLLFIFALCIGLSTSGMILYTRHALDWAPAEVFANTAFNPEGMFFYVILQWVKLCLIAGLALLISSLSQSMLFSVIVSFLAMGVSLLNASDFGSAGNFAQLAASWIFPDLHVFAPSERFIFASVNFKEFFAAFFYGASYAAACALLAAYCFKTRRF